MIVGITGPTGSGKTSVIQSLMDKISGPIRHLCQDDFYNAGGFEVVQGYDDWDRPESFNMEKLKAEILLKEHPQEILFIDGLFLFSDPEMLKLLDLIFFLEVSKETCKQRRFQRDEWIRENPQYFDECVWPNFERYGHYKKIVEKQVLDKLIVLDGEKETEEIAKIILSHIEKKRMKQENSKE